MSSLRVALASLCIACSSKPPPRATTAPQPTASDEANGSEPTPPRIVGGVLGGVATPSSSTAPEPVDAPPPAASPLPLTQAEVDRVTAIRDREMAVLTRDPLFDAYLRRTIQGVTDPDTAFERGRVAGAALTARGIARLPDGQLLRWFALRGAMAESSLAMCAGMWNGQTTSAQIQYALAQLSDADVADWARLSADAGLLELQAKTPLKDDPEAIGRGLERIAESLPATDRTRFEAVRLGQRTTAEDQCFAIQVLHDRVAALHDALRIRFVRALAVIVAQ